MRQRIANQPYNPVLVRPHCGHDRACQSTTRRLHHRGHRLRLRQAAPDGMVPGHPLHDLGQERMLGDEAAPPSGDLLQRRLAHPTQADADDDGARPQASTRRMVRARRRLSRRRAGIHGCDGRRGFTLAIPDAYLQKATLPKHFPHFRLTGRCLPTYGGARSQTSGNESADHFLILGNGSCRHFETLRFHFLDCLCLDEAGRPLRPMYDDRKRHWLAYIPLIGNRVLKTQLP